MNMIQWKPFQKKNKMEKREINNQGWCKMEEAYQWENKEGHGC